MPPTTNSYSAPASDHNPTDANANANPFSARFAAPLGALQVVEDGPGSGPGTALWAAGGGEVWRWRLGL